MKNTVRTVILILALSVAGRGFPQEILTLQKALEIGLENNYSIRLQRNAEAVARNNNTLGNAGFLPVVDLSAGRTTTLNNTHQEQFSGTVRDVTNARNTSMNLGAELNWTLFDGMNMFVGKRMLEILEELGENGTRLVVEGAMADIAMNWYSIIQMKELVRVAREAADLSAKRKGIAAAKVSFGAGSQLMLLQSTVDLNADSTALITRLTALDHAKADLNRLLCRDPGTPFEIRDSIRLGPSAPFDSLLALARKQNTALSAARLNLDLAGKEVQLSRSARYPQLDLSAGYSYNTSSAETGFLKYNRSYGLNLGLTLSYRLFNGFNATRAIRNARILVNSGEIDAQETELEVRTSLYKIYGDLIASTRIVVMQEVNVGVARENVAIAFEKYQLGSINDIELREIQQKLIDAEYQLILARFEAKKASVEIGRLVGKLPVSL